MMSRFSFQNSDLSINLHVKPNASFSHVRARIEAAAHFITGHI